MHTSAPSGSVRMVILFVPMQDAKLIPNAHTVIHRFMSPNLSYHPSIDNEILRMLRTRVPIKYSPGSFNPFPMRFLQTKMAARYLPKSSIKNPLAFQLRSSTQLSNQSAPGSALPRRSSSAFPEPPAR